MTAQFGQCCYVIAVHDVAATQAYFVDKLAFEPLEIDAPGWRFVQRGTARFDMWTGWMTTMARSRGAGR